MFAVPATIPKQALTPLMKKTRGEKLMSNSCCPPRVASNRRHD
jgi:hypothetical protein